LIPLDVEVAISPTITICRLTTYQLHFGSNSKFNMVVSCQEGWHRPVLSLFTKVFCVFSCILPKVAYFQKFAFAKRSRAMKAPVGLLSDRTVLRSKMEGPRPDKFAFAKRSGAMKAPVGLLSDRTVLRSKMEGPRPDKFAFAKRSGAMKAPVGLLSDRTVLRSKMEGPRPDKFAFAKRSGAMKAPVGLLSDRTVLRSKMEGPRPDKFTLTRHEFCGNPSQQFNIYIFLLIRSVPAGLGSFPF
jgi:hypothetical protein